MKKYKPKFKYWEDDHTKILRSERDDKWADDREWYCRQLIRSDEKWPHDYFLNQHCWKLMREQGPFELPYFDCEVLADRYKNKTAFIFCPGPTMPREWNQPPGVVSIAVNSAGFSIDANFWCMAESGYAKWLLDQRHPRMPILATARVATVLRDADLKHRGKNRFGPVYVLRWEEEGIVPWRTPAVSITNALVTAWQMGCNEAYLLGLDLSKKGGPYVKGVPHTQLGADNPFDDQIKALKQFSLPDFKVYNCSPLSKDTLNFESLTYEAVQDAFQVLGGCGLQAHNGNEGQAQN